MTTQSQIEARRNNAKKQALKVVSDAWKSDNKSADSIADMEGLKQSKVSEMNEIRAKMKDIENTKKSLQEEYGVADGSQEQKDLELLEKYQNNMNGSSYDQFSDEELSRLKELQNAPLTEYQKKVLNLNSMKGQVSVEADRKQFEVNALTASISDATLEQLKSRDMEKASDAADEIMDSANKEILGMLIEEGKNNADEKVEEEKEKAEELIRGLSQKAPMEGQLVSVERKKETKNPPLLYNLAELQNDCSKMFKISPDETLKIVQDLYEKKLVTYPRTDARVLSTAVAKVISKNISGLRQLEKLGGFAGEILDKKAYTGLSKTRYVNDKQITDHYAIIPTGQGLGALKSQKELSVKVYEVIARRFLSIFYPPAIYQKYNLEIVMDGPEEKK